MAFIGQFQQMVATIGPYFLHGGKLGSLLQAFALEFDAAKQTLDLGLRQAYPLMCHVDSLPGIAADRGIPLYDTEPEQSKRVRCANHRVLHAQRATHQGEMRHAQPYFFPDQVRMRIVHQDGRGESATWHTLSEDGTYEVVRRVPSNWNWDGQASQFSRFWVIVYAPARLLSLPHYGIGLRYGFGSRYAGAASTQIAKDLVAMIRGWQGPHAQLHGYIVTTDPNLFAPNANITTNSSGWTSHPNGTWAQPITPAGIRTRNPSAIFIYDRR